MPPLARRWHFYVDVVGGCNLRCPSCPVGNSPRVKAPKGAMAPERLDRIVRKALSECEQVKFDLYNWTEPLLHPRLPEMIQVVRAHGIRCGLSTNLNISKRIEEVLRADPTDLKVSLSGFEQGSYGVTHRDGDIDVVKRNMEVLARARERTGARTRLEVVFHRYLGNHEDEDRMRAYAQSLGFEFDAVWAFMLPLEKVLAFSEGESSALGAEDHALIERLALPLAGALAAARAVGELPCKLRDEQMTLNCEGEVMLCCATYDPSHYALGSYLEIALPELQRRKYAHSACARCMRQGIHVLYTGGTQAFDPIAREHVRKRYPDAELPQVRGLATRPRSALRRAGRRLRKSLHQLWR
jgi:pyruvate-formate lyase-activating enzyme